MKMMTEIWNELIYLLEFFAMWVGGYMSIGGTIALIVNITILIRNKRKTKRRKNDGNGKDLHDA